LARGNRRADRNLKTVLRREETYYLERLRRLNLAVRSHLRDALLNQDPVALAQVAREAPEDTIYRIDVGVEEVLLAFCADWAREAVFAVVAEGLEGGRRMFPEGSSPADAEFVLIADPIDGTRPLMYDKRAGWALSAVAAPRGGRETARDIVVAAQTELPTSRQHLSAHLFAVSGQGFWAEQHDVLTGEVSTLRLQPSSARDLRNGFAGFVKFFPAGKAAAVSLEDKLFHRLYHGKGAASIFDDQYISSGGQLFELMAGHDRFVADVRPLLRTTEGEEAPCSHPYDLCTELIAREAGVIVTDLAGGPLDFPLDLTSPVGWVGYANAALRDTIEPVLKELLHEPKPGRH
jgi:fructose-1,6-bisphosphatase/inositol monophosphatase family enzyme